MNGKNPPVEDLEKHKEAAAWMYRRRDGVSWWHPEVLTAANPDASSLCFDGSVSYSIFDYFLSKGYIRRVGEITATGDGKPSPIYSIIERRIKDFKKFSNLPWYIKHVPEAVFRWLNRFRGWITVASILIATSFFQSFSGKWGEALYDWLSKADLQKGILWVKSFF